MSFPALEAFIADRGVRRLAFRIYMHLIRDSLDFTTPKPVKVATTADALHIRPESVIRWLNWMVEKGYLNEHPRGPRRVRYFTLAWTRRPANAAESAA